MIDHVVDLVEQKAEAIRAAEAKALAEALPAGAAPAEAAE
jgi:hypothetical protein